jgi:uncharacterized membrane protein
MGLTVTMLAAPLVIIAFSVPLILGKVPPNMWYGFRTPTTLSSPDIWYRANRASGIYFAIAGAVMLLATAVLLASGRRPETTPWFPVVAIVVPILIALVASIDAVSKLK